MSKTETEVELSNVATQPRLRHNDTNQPLSSDNIPDTREADDAEDCGLTRPVALKLMCAGFSFFCAGVNDGALGTLIPYFLKTFNLGYGLVTIIYAVSFVGWLVAGFTNNFLLSRFNMGGMLALGAILQLTAHIIRSFTPPFPLFCIAFGIVALGQAYQDSLSNSFVSEVKGAHRWLGFIHASYAIGLLVSPFIANAVAVATDKRGGPDLLGFGLFYLAPLALGIANLALVLIAFRDCLLMSQKAASAPNQVTRRERNLWHTVKLRGVWQLSLFFFFFLGASFCFTGWLVEYLVTVRHGALTKMGYVPAAVAGGSVLGRAIIPEPAHRFGERKSVIICCALWLAFQLIFWLVPNLAANIAMTALIGICSGPFFPLGISTGAQLFSKEDTPAALGFVFIAAQAGGAIFPTITGVIATSTSGGVSVLQPITIGLIVASLGSWCIIPKALVTT